MKTQKINHRKALKIVKESLDKLHNSNQTFEDIYNISFSFSDNILFYECKNLHEGPITYLRAKSFIDLASSKIHEYFIDVPKNSFIGIMLNNSPSWIYSFYGLLKAGYRPYLVNMRNKLKDNIILFKELDIKGLIASENIDGYVTLLEDKLLSPTNKLPNDIHFADEIALSTSGTSGKFKTVIYNGKAISAQIDNAYYIVKKNKYISKTYKGELHHLLFLPLYHIFGLVAVFLWFSFFGRSFIFPKDISSPSLKFATNYYEATHIFAVPLFWNTVSDTILNLVKKRGPKIEKKFQKGLKISISLQKLMPNFGKWIARNILFKSVIKESFGPSLQCCISGGGIIKSSTLKIINAIGYPLFNGYGMSEVGIVSFEMETDIKHRLNGSVGVPFPSVTYKLVDSIYHEKELLINGDSIFYKMFVDGKWLKRTKNDFYKTNDLVEYKDGEYYIKTRLDDLIVSQGGENISPDLLMNEFNLPYVKSFTILGTNSGNLYQDIALVIYFENIGTIFKKRTLIEIKNTIVEHNLPINKVLISKEPLPLVLDSKVSRNALKEIINNRYDLFMEVDLAKIDEKSNGISEDDLLPTIINIFQSLFPGATINKNTSFIFDLKGDSLTYFELLTKISSTFNIEINKIDVYPQTPSEFLKLIERILNEK